MIQYPIKVEELLEEEFYAILFPENMTIPGDERSRTNPGHGYPEHTVDHWRIEQYASKEAWIKEIERLSNQEGYYKTKFKAVIIKPFKIKTKISLELE